jgi:uncharacterized protein
MRFPSPRPRRTFLAALLAFSITSAVTVSAGAATLAETNDFIRVVQLDDGRSVKSMLDAGFDPNALDQGGEPALVLAVREGSMKALRVLLAHPGIRVDATARNGNTALMMAAFKNNIAAVDALLAKGAAVNRDGWTPLHYAAAAGSDDIAAVLLKRGARIDAVSPKPSGSYTPLMMAAREGHPDSAAFLLGQGADPLRRNGEGLTAAQIAERAGHTKIAEQLRAPR